uniref:Uncharacterized protein n=1 Tax=Glycine max TaxID=3847 RepID=K7KD10_SOYBN
MGLLVKAHIELGPFFGQNLTNIRHLCLDGVSILVPEDEWCSVLMPLRDLQELSMSWCGLSRPLDPSLTRLENLSVIVLDGNKYYHPQCQKTFLHFKNIIILSLTNCGSNGTFPHKIFNIGTLSVIDTSWNNNLHGFLPEFPSSRSLYSLSVSNTNLSGEIPSFIGNMRKLSELNLSKCGFSRTISNSLLNLTKLVQIDSLDISNNNLSGRIPSFLFTSQSIELFHNQFSQLDKIRNVSRLYSLDLSSNDQFGPFSTSILQLSTLFVLHFSSNQFNGSVQLNKLLELSLTSFLSLSNNTLDGSIPNSIYIASSLQVFDLSLNNIYGTIISCHIPYAIPASCSLWILNLHGNLLDGPIPNSLSCCLKLKVLDLGLNQIIGGFPCFLKKISTLRILVLWKNKFQGSLRCSKTNKTWEIVQIVDIAFNNFSGKLPGKYFTTWERYIMHGEQETESKLMELVKIFTIFTSIDFSSNHFKGPITKEHMDFKELYIFLSKTTLSSEIPLSIGNLRRLESLCLSQN